MKRVYVLGFVAVLGGVMGSVFGAFTPGNLVILTDQNSGDSAGAITLEEYAYNPLTGTFNISPTAHGVSGVTLPGTNDHDGLLHISSDGGYLTFGGYEAAVGTASVLASGATRAIGAVDSNWNLTTTAITGYSGVSIRSVVSTDGKHFWTGGDQGTNGGQYYVDASGPVVSQVLISSSDARANWIDHGQLWGVSSSVGGASKVGIGLPTSGATSALAMTGGYVKSDVVFLDLNNDGESETAYTTDGKNLLGKWSYNGSSWSQTGSWSGDKTFINNINSLEAYVYNGTVELLAATQTGQLFQFADSNGMGSGFSFSNTTPLPYLTATDGSVFRGMAILVPEPTGVVLFGMAVVSLVARRRRNVGTR